jgi:hypothetical protein
MNIQPAFKELLELLGKNKVEYMIVGGYAVAYHGYPRFTKAMDIFFECSQENIDRIIVTLTQFGFSRKDLNNALFAAEGNIVTFGNAPIRVDFLNKIDGVEFSEAKRGRIPGKYGDIDVFFIGREHLLQNKNATLRARDKADAEELS